MLKSSKVGGGTLDEAGMLEEPERWSKRDRGRCCDRVDVNSSPVSILKQRHLVY